MFENTFKVEDVEVTVGATERGLTPYLSVSFPNLVEPFNEGPTVLLYGDAASNLSDALRLVPLLVAAHKIGTNHGVNAASWFEVDDEDGARRVLGGMADGDPEVMDALPSPDLSGQWADGYTITQLCEDVDLDEGDEAVDEVVQAYEDAFTLAAHAEVEKRCLIYCPEGVEGVED